MPLSNYGENLFLDVLFGAAVKPSTYYVALCYTEPTDTSTGSNLNEPSAASYARASIPNNATSWSPADAGVKRNDVAVAFNTAAEDWGTSPLLFFALTTQATGGFLVAWGVLGAGRRVYSGMTPRFEAGDMTITSAD